MLISQSEKRFSANQQEGHSIKSYVPQKIYKFAGNGTAGCAGV
jgi:hypothetical protein